MTKKALIIMGALAFVLQAGCSDDSPGQGEEGGLCYPNNSCNDGLLCVLGICVRVSDGGPPRDANGMDWQGFVDQGGEVGTGDMGPDGPPPDAFVFVPDAAAIPDGVTGAPKCGDGVVNQSSEQCDGADLGNTACYNLSFDFGPLSCKTDCTFDTTSCRMYGFKTLAAGSFTMGSHHLENCRDKTDEDQHTVKLTRSFSMATTPVTQRQFQMAMGYNPSSQLTCGSDCPVDTVTWHEAAAYSNALSIAGKFNSCYSCLGSGPFVSCQVKAGYAGANIYACPGYRLPTEAEWEYAYRAGTYSAYYNGSNNNATCNDCNTRDVNAHQIAWYCHNSPSSTMPVGHKQANTLGLYDMAGNVGEWTNDYYLASLGMASATDPAGPATGTYRVRRGLSTDRKPHGLRAAEREPEGPSYPAKTFSGFRLVRTSAGGAASCGNAVVDAGEQCDGVNLLGLNCASLGYTGGTLACSACSLDVSSCTGSTAVCGNGKIEAGEECDGNSMGGVTCASLGFTGGTLSCSACQRVTSACVGGTASCGNGIVDSGEECDGLNLAGATCSSLGYTGGTLGCSAGCARDLSNCTGSLASCGNGLIEPGEQCDLTNLGGLTCVSLGFTGGSLTCSAACARNLTGCVSGAASCGNGNIEATEQCDGSNLAGATCLSLGYTGGTLTCSAACLRNVSGCTGKKAVCSNGLIEAGEECDGSNLGGLTCASMGYATGALSCSTSCQRILTGCSGGVASCGNGLIEAGEQCDGVNLGGQTCTSLGYAGGPLTCGTTCQRVVSACIVPDAGIPPDAGSTPDAGVPDAVQPDSAITPDSTQPDSTQPDSAQPDSATGPICGDSLITGQEDCDGTQLGGYTCATLGLGAGNLTCNSTTCLFDTSGCAFASGSAWISFSAGSYYMGAPSSEPCSEPYGYIKESRHQVTLTRAFEIMAAEVTQAEFLAVMNYNWSTNSICGTACPVENVSWSEAAAYANALSVQKSLTPCYSCSGSGPTVSCGQATAYSGSLIYSCPGYRLPTEAEWEYAYRAGTSTAYYSGINSATTCATCTTLEANAGNIGWYCANATNSGGFLATQQVGQRVANARGVYDMAGNVREWVHDSLQNDLGTASATDPVVSPTSVYRVTRGADFNPYYARGLRAAHRIYASSTHKDPNLGFRLVRTTPSGGSSTP